MAVIETPYSTGHVRSHANAGGSSFSIELWSGGRSSCGGVTSVTWFASSRRSYFLVVRQLHRLRLDRHQFFTLRLFAFRLFSFPFLLFLRTVDLKRAEAGIRLLDCMAEQSCKMGGDA